MVRKVPEVDSMLCPSFGARMRVISFIEDHKVTERIIAHLELTFETGRPPPSHHVQQELRIAAEEMEEYLWASAGVFCLFEDRVYLRNVDGEASGDLWCFLDF